MFDIQLKKKKIMKHTAQQKEMTHYQKRKQSIASVPKVADTRIIKQGL